MTLDIRRGTSRFETRESGILTRHGFSFGRHYHPGNVDFGPLTCHDDHELAPGHGFAAHPHHDVEIVTWVLGGSLVHDGTSTLTPGQVAVQSAGTGITHSEVAGDAGCRFVQAWLRPDSPGGTPARAVADVELEPGRLTGLAGAGGPLPVGVAGAALAGVRLEEGSAVRLPDAPRLHVFVATGSVRVADQALGEGDALRLTDEPAPLLGAGAAAELLVWSLPR